MAAADYYLCDDCGCKTFYDADLAYGKAGGNPSTGHPWPAGVGWMIVLCGACAAKHAISIVGFEAVLERGRGQ